MANLISVRLNKGDSPSWGFRLQGGKDFGTPLVIQKISGGSPAERAGLIAGDTVFKINNIDVYNLRHKDAQDVILRAGPSFEIQVQRGGSTWKPSVTPVGSVPPPRAAAPISNISPVTATSLTAGRQDTIGAIGTSHNVSAKPFGVGQVNGGPRLVNKQYNSPLPLYSEQSIAETLSAQTEVLSNGVLGVNFKKNEKSYDAANSAVFRMVQEADKEPRDYEPGITASCQEDLGPEPDTSGVITAPLGIAGLRHVQAPESKPAPPTPQLPPGQNICADCERLIVGVFVRIKDKNLHVECFKCSTCGTSLKNVGYYNLNNKLYCDVHAKLAARSNPPAPNLQPITVPPGGKIPAGAISAPLSSHAYPTPAPLSPSTHYSAAPYQPGASFSSPRPFSSVNAPVSPSSTFPKLSPTPASSTPLAGRYSSVKPAAPLREESRGVQNIVWPPIQNEPELPTASPLYFPPPSQVQPLLKQTLKNFEHSEEQEYCELEEMSYITQTGDRNMSLCSAEVSSITGRRSAVECSETISDTLDAQILVESIMQTRSRSPQVRPKSPPPADVNVTFTISEAKLKQGAYANTLASSSVCETTQSKESTTCSLKETKQSQSLASMYEKKIKVENTVPQKWESPMVVALTVASDKPYSQPQTQTPCTENHQSASNGTFSQIPPKRSTSALASALAIAPTEPFTPVTSSSLEPVPLPEETVPYFPPEHPVVIDPKHSNENIQNTDTSHAKATSGAPIKKKQTADDALFKDLPKPPLEKISLLAALTTAPERPYSPLTVDMVSYHTEDLEKGTSEVKSASEITHTKQKSKATLSESSKSQSFLKDVSRMSENKQKFASSCTSQEATSYQTVTSIKDQSKLMQTKASEVTDKQQESKKVLDVQSLDKSSKSQLVSKNIRSTEDITKLSSGMPPMIQLVRSSFETKTDKVQMEMSCQFLGDPVTQQQIIQTSSSKTDTLEEQISQNSISEKQETLKTSQKEIKETQCQSQSQKDLKTTSAVAKAFVQQHTDAASFSESVLLQKATSQAKSGVQTKQSIEQSEEAVSTFKTTNKDFQTEKKCSHVQAATLHTPSKERVTVVQPGQTLNVPEISFQPVTEDTAPSTTFSSRPRPITPSMINKPAPVIPSYQASLAAVQCAPPETNVFDPTSPATSRSPSPYRGRPTSPFPTSAGRAASPAPGPPPNPLQSHKSASQLIQEGKMQQARSRLQSYIPQYQSQVGSCQAQETLNYSQQSLAVSNSCQQQTSDAVSVSMSSKQQQLHDMAKLKNIGTSRDGSIQTEKKKKISEEYEHSQKSQVVQIEKCSSGVQVHSTQKTNGLVLENQAVAGFHLTNPQPLKSPFIAADDASTNKPLVTPTTSQNVFQTDSCKKIISSAIPKLIKSAPTSSGSAPTAIAFSSVNVNRPNISQPNTGTGGGRQAGAIGVAPKRGRGILNLAATPGSRVPLCAQCHSNIRGPFITALGKIWCPEHFVCATPSCRRALHDLGFVEERGQLYCEYCFEQYLAPPCAKCSAKVKGDCLKAIGKNFHPECFNCVYCGKLFGNSPFFLEDGQPYCETDWNELFTTKCFACGFPVEAGDRWVEALNNNYHSQCFNCTMCKKNLEGQSFFAKGGRPFCKNHAR